MEGVRETYPETKGDARLPCGGRLAVTGDTYVLPSVTACSFRCQVLRKWESKSYWEKKKKQMLIVLKSNCSD